MAVNGGYAMSLELQRNIAAAQAGYWMITGELMRKGLAERAAALVERMVEGAVYPVILHNECESIPYFGVGTAFLLEHEGHLFAITAQHVLDNQNARNSDLRLLLKDNEHFMLFDMEAVFNPEYEPHYDLLIRRVTKLQHKHLVDSGAYWVHTSSTIVEEGFHEVSAFWAFGYPEEGRGYDYDRKAFSASLEVFGGNYSPPEVPGLGTIKLFSDGPSSFRGMSGSLVLADLDDMMRFAGMVTMASERSGIVNFIPASVIVHYLDRLNEMAENGLYVEPRK